MKGRVGQDNWLDIRLEDLGADLHTIQKKLECFLDIRHDEKFLKKAEKQIKPDRTDKKRWKDGKTEAQIEFMLKEMGETLFQFGYTTQ